MKRKERKKERGGKMRRNVIVKDIALCGQREMKPIYEAQLPSKPSIKKPVAYIKYHEPAPPPSGRRSGLVISLGESFQIGTTTYCEKAHQRHRNSIFVSIV